MIVPLPKPLVPHPALWVSRGARSLRLCPAAEDAVMTIATPDPFSFHQLPLSRRLDVSHFQTCPVHANPTCRAGAGQDGDA